MSRKEDYKSIRAGSLLLSEPFSDDPYFKRSVILIVEHEEHGDVGFILNKCLGICLCDLVDNFPDDDYTLCLGGPVNPSTLHYLHPYEDLPGNVRIADGLYWGGDFEILRDRLFTGEMIPAHMKFFLGYSGWERGQLMEEMQSGLWGVVPGTEKNILRATGDLWYDIAGASDRYRKWTLVPEDPEDN